MLNPTIPLWAAQTITSFAKVFTSCTGKRMSRMADLFSPAKPFRRRLTRLTVLFNGLDISHSCHRPTRPSYPCRGNLCTTYPPIRQRSTLTRRAIPCSRARETDRGERQHTDYAGAYLRPQRPDEQKDERSRDWRGAAARRTLSGTAPRPVTTTKRSTTLRFQRMNCRDASSSKFRAPVSHTTCRASSLSK